MKTEQVAQAVINDRGTEQARRIALATWISGNDNGAVHCLLPTVFAELAKPIYEGVKLDGAGGPYEVARMVLDWEIDWGMLERAAARHDADSGAEQ